MEKIKSPTELYQKRLHLIFAVSGGVSALLIAIETLIGALSALGVSHPENGLHTVKTYIFGATDYKSAAFILAALTIFICVRYNRVRQEHKPLRYVLITLCIREGAVAVSELGHYALKLLGIDGGVNTLISKGGYLLRMVDPLITVILGAITAVFSIAYLCAFFVTITLEDKTE